MKENRNAVQSYSFQKMLFWLLILCIGAAYGEDGQFKSYENYIILNVTPQDDLQVGYLAKLSKDPDLDFLSGPYCIGETSSVMIPPSRRKEVKRSLVEREIHHSVKIENVQNLINEVRKRLKAGNEKYSRVRSQEELWYFKQYHLPDEVLEYVTSLQALHPDLVSFEDIGTTYEGRNLRVLKIGIGNKTDKPAIWIQGGIHAREWITTPAAMYIAYQLVSNYKTDTNIKKSLGHFDWYIMPLVNPDGLQYSRTTDYYWRKNRRPLEETNAIGVDLNRNFGYKWGEGKTIQDKFPVSVSYEGPEAFSEAEAQAISRVLTKMKDRLKLYFDFHSYGNKWITPFAYTLEMPADYPEMKRMYSYSDQAMAGTGAASFSFIPASRMYGETFTGIAIDWTYGELKCIHSYALELTNGTSFSFFPPEDSILPHVSEVWTAVRAASLYLLD